MDFLGNTIVKCIFHWLVQGTDMQALAFNPFFRLSSQRYGLLRPHSWSSIANSLITAIFHHQLPNRKSSTGWFAKRGPNVLTFA